MTKPKMHFRLVSEGNASLTIGTDNEKLNDELFDETFELVSSTFKRLMPGIQKIDGMTPEIMSEATVEYIDSLETLMQHMRNLMNDSDQDQEGDWGKAIDAADELLGFDFP